MEWNTYTLFQVGSLFVGTKYRMQLLFTFYTKAYSNWGHDFTLQYGRSVWMPMASLIIPFSSFSVSAKSKPEHAISSVLILEWFPTVYGIVSKLFTIAYKDFYDLISDSLSLACCCISLHILFSLPGIACHPRMNYHLF